MNEERGPISRNVKVLSAVSLAQDTGSEIMYPLLPTFITGVLGAPVVAVGVAEGLADAVAAGMKLVAGRLSRARKRRRWIAAGYALAAVGKAVVAAAFVWPVVILGRVVDRIGKGVRGVPRDALIADEVSDHRRGRAFGFHRTMDTLGAVIGPLLGLGLYRAFGHRMRPTLMVALIPAVVSVLLVGLVRERPAGASLAAAPPDGLDPPSGPARARVADLPPRYWRVMVPLLVFALVNSTDALLLQRARQLGLSVSSVVLVYVLYNVVYAGLSYPAGWLSDRVPPRRVFAGGLLVFGAAYIGMGRARGAGVVWVLLPAYGAYTALTDGVSRAWITGLVPATDRGWALGVHGAGTGVATLLAGLWSGLAWQGSGRLPLTISGGVAMAVAAWLAVSPGP